MAFSLYAATIPSYEQILGSVSGLLGTAEAFCAEKGIAPEDIIQARLAEDMLPFAYQVKSTAVHSLGAIEGVRRGVFSPDMTPPPESFAALKARIAETLAALAVIRAGRSRRLRRARHALRTRGAPSRLYRRELPPVLLAAELLLSCGHGLRHSALEGCSDREARFYGEAPHEADRGARLEEKRDPPRVTPE